ncbi:hypothetical protein AB0E96_23035 [Kitasatospora sp. NPDC036755]|uniref:hypothetical protein n=1 Tax=Kitasatospora sp. NPDC036755 TaxID=3154600 RepID=UPI0034081ABD
MKSNPSQDRIALLGGARVTRVRPGVESLNSRVLGLMDKGVTGARNLRTMRECENHALTCVWNHLHRSRGERDEEGDLLVHDERESWPRRTHRLKHRRAAAFRELEHGRTLPAPTAPPADRGRSPGPGRRTHRPGTLTPRTGTGVQDSSGTAATRRLGPLRAGPPRPGGHLPGLPDPHRPGRPQQYGP